MQCRCLVAGTQSCKNKLWAGCLETAKNLGLNQAKEIRFGLGVQL